MRHVQSLPRRVVMCDTVWVTLSDGVRLAARIWLPENAVADATLPAFAATEAAAARSCHCF